MSAPVKPGSSQPCSSKHGDTKATTAQSHTTRSHRLRIRSNTTDEVARLPSSLPFSRIFVSLTEVAWSSFRAKSRIAQFWWDSKIFWYRSQAPYAAATQGGRDLPCYFKHLAAYLFTYRSSHMPILPSQSCFSWVTRWWKPCLCEITSNILCIRLPFRSA